jgi:hypothetical protein
MTTIQERNSELVNLLLPDFQMRNEPNFAWKSAVSSCLAIPSLVACWPMSAIRRDSATDEIRDMAGGGYHLTAHNVPQSGYDDLTCFEWFNGTNQWLSRADGGAANWADITGTETKVFAAGRGLTMGIWVYFMNAAGANAMIIGKWEAVGSNDRSYRIMRQATGVIRAIVSVDGTAATVIDSAAAPAINTWTFLAMRFVPSTTLDVYVNTEKTTLAAAVPASIFDGIADFTIASYHNGLGQWMNGRVSLAWLSMSWLSDSIIDALFQQQRAAFGV